MILAMSGYLSYHPGRDFAKNDQIYDIQNWLNDHFEITGVEECENFEIFYQWIEVNRDEDNTVTERIYYTFFWDGGDAWYPGYFLMKETFVPSGEKAKTSEICIISRGECTWDENDEEVDLNKTRDEKDLYIRNLLGGFWQERSLKSIPEQIEVLETYAKTGEFIPMTWAQRFV